MIMKDVGNDYSWQGMVIVTILGMMGVLMVYFTGIFSVYDYNSFLDCINEYGMLIIFGAFFTIVSIYCWILFFQNAILKPKKETLYLQSIDEDMCTFINKKGELFYIENNSYELEKFYVVLKTRNYIHEVLEISNDKFEIPKIKESFWLNFYTPIGNFENVFLLPIAYVIALPGLLSFIASKGWEKIFAVIYLIVPMYVIFYDLIFKIKKKKCGSVELVDDFNLKKSYSFLINFFKIAPIVFLNGLFIYGFIKSADAITRWFMSFFLLATLCGSIMTIATIFNKNNIVNILNKIYHALILLFMALILLAGTIGSFKQKQYLMLLILIPLWILVFYLAYKHLLKKDKTSDNND